MSETSKRSNRRRRRPRRQSKPKNKAAQAAEHTVDGAPAQANKSSNSRRNRRSGRRRKPQTGGGKVVRGNSDLVYQQHNVADLDISPIDKNIFIYTYTLRPQSLLDNYQVGPGVVENMEFEDAHSTKNQIDQD